MKKYLLMLVGALMLVSCGTTKYVSPQSASTIYKVGDIYNQNGVKGIVVLVDASRQHGLIMSLEASKGSWCSKKDLRYSTNAFFEDDGEKNMIAIENCIKENNATWDDFPIFQWARSLGDGWYIPAKNELIICIPNIQRAFKNVKALNKHITSYGGDRYSYAGTSFGIWIILDQIFRDFDTPYTMFSSTESKGGKYVCIYGGGDQMQKWASGVNHVRTRAFHKF